MQVAASGAWGRVVWATDATGNMPAREFYLTLTDQEKAKVQANFGLLASTGRIPNEERFKHLQDGLWEFKNFQIRFLGDFAPGYTFMVAMGLRKKKNRHRREDIERARRILSEHESRKA